MYDTQDEVPKYELTAKARAAAEKESRASSRQCFDGELTHVRLGDWRGLYGAEVTFVGTAAQLHGTVCSCCPRRVS